MNERQATSLAALRARAALSAWRRCRPGWAGLAVALLVACGQKGPLDLPAANAAAARPVERLPSAPDDAMPHGPITIPSPGTGSPRLPSGVVPAK